MKEEKGIEEASSWKKKIQNFILMIPGLARQFDKKKIKIWIYKVSAFIEKGKLIDSLWFKSAYFKLHVSESCFS